MAGFLETAVRIHTSDDIPVAFFCTGNALEKRADEFQNFAQQVRHNQLFDIQNHSYSHVGIGYSKGLSVDDLKIDYERSFRVHEQMFGNRPRGVASCGVSTNGTLLSGFDATEKTRAELAMLAKLGVRMYNTFLTGHDATTEFVNYKDLGYPNIMGFPSGHTDVFWMHDRAFGDPLSYITKKIEIEAAHNRHMSIVMHDWCAWKSADDQKLTHVRRIADVARKHNYTIVTPFNCLKNQALWQE